MSLRKRWDQRQDLRRNADLLAATVTVKTSDDRADDPLVRFTVGSLLDLPRPLRRKVLANLRTYYLDEAMIGYPWNDEEPAEQPWKPDARDVLIGRVLDVVLRAGSKPLRTAARAAVMGEVIKAREAAREPAPELGFTWTSPEDGGGRG